MNILREMIKDHDGVNFVMSAEMFKFILSERNFTDAIELFKKN